MYFKYFKKKIKIGFFEMQKKHRTLLFLVTYVLIQAYSGLPTPRTALLRALMVREGDVYLFCE